MTTTCNHALYAIVDVFTQYYDIMSPILIDELYSQLKWCVKQDNEQLARSATNCLENFVISNGPKMNSETWDKTCVCIQDIFKSTIPYNLLTWKPNENSSNTAWNNNHEDSFNNNDVLLNSTFSANSTRKIKRKDSTNSVNSAYSEDSLLRPKIPHTKVPMDMEHKVFQSLLIKCVVQLELVQTIDSIVFFPTTSKKEDASYILAAQVCA
jgi:brefeldin A-inhibited guanine nucleotide-exchange protein